MTNISINDGMAIRYIFNQKVKLPTSLNAFFDVMKLICSVAGLLVNTSAMLNIVRRSPLRITPANIFLLVINFLYSPFLYAPVIEFIYSNWYPVHSVYQTTIALAPRYYTFMNVWLALIDRYAAIRHSAWYEERMTTPVACGIIVFSSTSAFLVNFLSAVELDIHDCIRKNRLAKILRNPTPSLDIRFTINLPNQTCVFFILTIIIAIKGFIFIMCTAANLLAFACRKSMSCESHRVDSSTSTTTEDTDVVSGESSVEIEQAAVKENEKKPSNNVLVGDCAYVMPDRWNRKTVNAVWKLDVLSVMLFSLAAVSYIFVAVLFLTFVHRYATGKHQGEANWATFWLQYLTLTFPSFYGFLVFFVRNKKLWYCVSKIDRRSLMSYEEFLREWRKHYTIDPRILLTSPRFLYWALGISILVLFIATILRHAHLRNQPTNVFRLAMAFSYLSVFIPDVIEFIYWFLFPIEYVCNGYVPLIYVPPAIVFVNVILALADYYAASKFPLWYEQMITARFAWRIVTINSLACLFYSYLFFFSWRWWKQ
ncbi:hypothetical protein GHT06_019213 [Daphnia sinensis]|uniref:G-protein coupled receptors family 1 profile domain-containing protein n=1 Tax=Daphnia sinensis TaxID=1820382 RepID=A0AAD5KL05_9CRUS|nr:hypothetical protein GHT06_019213 [Daphnia sinensis]